MNNTNEEIELEINQDVEDVNDVMDLINNFSIDEEVHSDYETRDHYDDFDREKASDSDSD